MYKEYTQKRQKFVVFIAVSSEYRCIQPQNNRLKIISKKLSGFTY